MKHKTHTVEASGAGIDRATDESKKERQDWEIKRKRNAKAKGEKGSSRSKKVRQENKMAERRSKTGKDQVISGGSKKLCNARNRRKDRKTKWRYILAQKLSITTEN